MKKVHYNTRLCIMSMCIMLLFGTNVSAQSFLKKMKEKVSAITQTTTSTQSDEANKILPAKGNSASELFKQMPDILSTQVLLDPLEEEQRRLYLDKLSSIELRMWELQQRLNEASMDDVIDENKINKGVASMYGLSPQEMQELSDENTSDKRRKELENKMAENMTGMSADQIAKLDKMSDKEQEAYVAQHADINKIKSTSKKAGAVKVEEADESLEMSKMVAVRTKEITDNYQANLNKVYQRSERYVADLKNGYNELYNTPSSVGRDAISDRLKIINEKGRNETVGLWRNAYVQMLGEYRLLCNQTNQSVGKSKLMTVTAQQLDYSILEEAIKQYRKALYFEGFKDVTIAHRRILQNNVGVIFSDEAALHFAPSDMGAADSVGCGSFQDSYFVVKDTLDNIRIAHKGSLSSPYKNASEALKKNPKTDNKPFAVADKTKYESSGGKRFAVVKNGDLILDNGSVFQYPFAINRCNDFVYWLVLSGDKIIEYSYRL